MLVLQLPPKVVNIFGTLSFPAVASAEANLLPAEVMGMEKLSGKLSLASPGQKVSTIADTVNGGVRFKVDGRLPKVSLTSRLKSVDVTIKEGRFRGEWECKDADDLTRGLQDIDILLPSVLASVAPCPCYIDEITGTIGEAGFSYEFRGTTVRGIVAIPVDGMAKRLDARMATLSRAAEAQDDITVLISAHRYLLQARKLGYVSGYSTEFLGERLLNLYKAIEVLFGRNAEELRRQLALLRVPGREAEAIFLALLYVRDEVDVGHAAIRPLSPDDWERMHDFAERAEDGVTWLLKHVTEAVAAGSYRVRTTEKSPKASKLLREIAKASDVRIDAYTALA